MTVKTGNGLRLPLDEINISRNHAESEDLPNEANEYLPELGNFVNRFYLLVVINFFFLVIFQSVSLFNLFNDFEKNRILPALNAVTPSAATSVEFLDRDTAGDTVNSLLELGTFRRIAIIDDFGRTLGEGYREEKSGYLIEVLTELLGFSSSYSIDIPLETPSTQTGMLKAEVNLVPLITAELRQVFVMIAVVTLLSTLLAYFLVVRTNRRIGLGIRALIESTDVSATAMWDQHSGLEKLQFSELETVAKRTQNAIKNLKETMTIVSDYETKQADLLDFIDAALTEARLYSLIFSADGDLLYSNTDASAENWIKNLSILNFTDDRKIISEMRKIKDVSVRHLGKTSKETESGSQSYIQFQVDCGDQSWLMIWSSLKRGALFVFVQEITRAQEDARRSSHEEKMEALGRISSGVAHEFNNMLGVIVANLDLAGQPNIQNSELHECIKSATRAADRAAAVVGQLKRISKADNEGLDFVNLMHWSRVVRPMLRAAVGPEIDLEIKCDEALFIKVNEAFLDTAIVNLCKNASEAIESRGRVQIVISSAHHSSLARHPYLPPVEYCEIAVSDNGPGISDEISNKIFEPFFTSKPLALGTGLGLSSVYSFVGSSNGTVHFERSKLGGAKFVLLFRKVQPPKTEKTDQHRDLSSNATLRGKNILIVEDEVGLSTSYRKALEIKEANVYSEASIYSAKRALKLNGKTDIAVIDKTLPDGNGLELARYISCDFPECKIILVSGNITGYEDDLVNVSKVIEKPFRLKNLIEACETLS